MLFYRGIAFLGNGRPRQYLMFAKMGFCLAYPQGMWEHPLYANQWRAW